MSLITNMTKKDNGDGSFTMTPIEGVPKTLTEYVQQWGDAPQGDAKLLEIDIERDEQGQPKILAGKKGPYVRLFMGRFKKDQIGSVQEIKIKRGTDTALAFNDMSLKNPRRRSGQGQRESTPATAASGD